MGWMTVGRNELIGSRGNHSPTNWSNSRKDARTASRPRLDGTGTKLRQWLDFNLPTPGRMMMEMLPLRVMILLLPCHCNCDECSDGWYWDLFKHGSLALPPKLTFSHLQAFLTSCNCGFPILPYQQNPYARLHEALLKTFESHQDPLPMYSTNPRKALYRHLH